MANQVDKTRVRMDQVRLSYTYLAEPVEDDYGKEKYKSQILIPKKSKTLLKQIDTAVRAAAVKKFGMEAAKKLLKNPQFKTPLRDAESEDREGEEYEGMMFLNATAGVKRKPGLVLRNGVKIVDVDEAHEHFYSGVWAYVSVNFFGFNAEGSKGVAVGINNVMKWKDDEHLDGSTSATTEFEDLFEGDTDLDDIESSPESAVDEDDDWDV